MLEALLINLMIFSLKFMTLNLILWE